MDDREYGKCGDDANVWHGRQILSCVGWALPDVVDLVVSVGFYEGEVDDNLTIRLIGYDVVSFLLIIFLDGEGLKPFGIAVLGFQEGVFVVLAGELWDLCDELGGAILFLQGF